MDVASSFATQHQENYGAQRVTPAVSVNTTGVVRVCFCVLSEGDATRQAAVGSISLPAGWWLSAPRVQPLLIRCSSQIRGNLKRKAYEEAGKSSLSSQHNGVAMEGNVVVAVVYFVLSVETGETS